MGMKILTFSGSSTQEALKRAMNELGDEAQLLETRELQKKSLSREPLYEVVVAIDERDIRPKSTKADTFAKAKEHKPLDQQRPLLQESNDVLFNISKAASQISKIADVTASSASKTGNKNLQEPEPFELKEIKKEIEKLGDKVKIIQNMFWDEKSQNIDVAIPPEFSEIYKLAFQSGMKKEHLDKIMQLTLEHMPFKMRENSITVKRYFQTLLRKMIPIRVENTPSHSNKKVIMLVGPTGVGKTTSIAKLAARFSYLMDKKYKVGLVVLDTYRIGAVEQLMQYARMMKLGIETVVDPPEFAVALESMSYCDYILIDTMGSSPYDREKIGKIYDCLNSKDRKFNIEVSLVMPSSIKYEDMLATYKSFSTLNIDSMMFTKLDETRGFGNIFSFVYETSKPISYFSIGQEVPEDLKVATSDFLIDCMLNGFSRGKE